MLDKLGVLGGMGPLATADFLRKLTEATPAQSDQEHIPTIVYSVPQIPDRSSAILGTGPSPLPALTEGARFLAENGAKAIAIPCNTAHFWHDALIDEVGVPIIHIVDAVYDMLPHDTGKREPIVGLLATAGTIRSRVYQKRLDRYGIHCLVPSDDVLETSIMPGIAAVKAGHITTARGLLEQATMQVLEQGADVVVMACTEIPLALAKASADLRRQLIDATSALAARCVCWWDGHRYPQRYNMTRE